MSKINHYLSLAEKRKRRVRSKMFGTAKKPRISVNRSNKYTYVQAIDDEKQVTLLGMGDYKIEKGSKIEKIHKVSQDFAKKLVDKKIKAAIFDRGSYKYHGRVKVVAESLREAGIKI